MREIGPLVASGRDGDIYEFGPGLVLRKTRDGRSIAHEAEIMEYVAARDFPVPKIHEVRAGGTEIVMERIDGPLMLDEKVSAVVKLPRMLALLADLHDRLHEIPAPSYLGRATPTGDRLLHLDLHPLNVLMSPTRGPVVIDWPNAAIGEPLFDVALTYVLLTCPRIPLPRPIAAVLDAIRRPMVNRTFAKRYRGPAFDAQIAYAADLKTLDENMHPDEVVRMQQLAARKRRALG